MSPAAAERLLRASLAFVWLATGLLVVHPYYRAEGTRWLAPLGMGPAIMVATCAAEVALAAVISWRRTDLWLALAQTGPILVFTAILAALDPMLLAHPYGVLTKNIPLVAAVWTAFLFVKEGETPRAVWILRAGMAAPWISEGIFPKILFQQQLELSVVTALGFSEPAAHTMIRAAGVAEVVAGVLALVLAGRLLAWLLAAEIAALVALPLLVTWTQPFMWAHPFGPLTKNVVILAGTYVLFRRCTRTSS